MRFYEDWLIQSSIKEVSKTKKVVNDWIKGLPKQDLKYLSTRGIKSKQYDLKPAFLQEKSFQFILENCAKKITEEFEKRNGEDPAISLNNAWTVIGNTNSFHAVHRHTEKPKNIISTVMYLSAPPKNPKDEKLKDMGDFYYFLNKRENLLLFNSVYPKTNDFFIFPSWIWHGAYPQIKGVRQTLNIDFDVIR
jgi:hypothetical protein